jgi:uncharacterized protein (TIGR03083 family)
MRPQRTGDNADVAGHSSLDLIDAIDDVLLTTLSLVRDLSENDAGRPTDCPGWTVRDQLSHMVGLEQVLDGAPQSDIELPPLAHVVSELDQFMERQVHIRRQLPLAAIADELAGLRKRRISNLRRLAADGDPDVAAPFGTRPLSKALPTRVFDLWTHEQDIRRAVGLPVRESCTAAEVSVDMAVHRWSAAMPKLLDGNDATVVISVSAPYERSVEIRIGAGGPVATIAGPPGEITRAFCGRGVPSGDLVSGDPGVVALLEGRLALTP